ncbi:MAG: cold shock domain-containing protein [Nanoarchaeota archaeon]|nr:cold shock domain-containing protein [Nanoarchaeota archaeon]
MKGKVKFFNQSKGFGFVSGEDGKDYFVHISGLKQGYDPAENDAVEFDVTQGDRGPKAANVRLDAGGSKSSKDSSEESEASEDTEDFSDDSEEKEEKEE